MWRSSQAPALLQLGWQCQHYGTGFQPRASGFGSGQVLDLLLITLRRGSCGRLVWVRSMEFNPVEGGRTLASHILYRVTNSIKWPDISFVE